MRSLGGQVPQDKILLTCEGGQVICPSLVLCDRADGGHLVVNPPRPVWERNALAPTELVLWSLLVAATGRAMLDTLPQLEGACLNYWEAGNWALNTQAQPVGPKSVEAHRRVHLHVFGRSQHAKNPDWQWGESPRLPTYANRLAWASAQKPLSEAECGGIARRCQEVFAQYRKASGPHS